MQIELDDVPVYTLKECGLNIEIGFFSPIRITIGWEHLDGELSWWIDEVEMQAVDITQRPWAEINDSPMVEFIKDQVKLHFSAHIESKIKEWEVNNGLV